MRLPFERGRAQVGLTVGAAAVAVALVAGAAVPAASAYFTTYVDAQGGYTLELKEVTTIPDEDFDREYWTKHVTIKNTGEATCFVRVRAFAGSQYALTYSGDGWSEAGDGWYYYADPVAPGVSTGTLDIVIKAASEETDTSADFNVSVVYETVPVTGASTALEADWDAPLDSGSDVYINEEA